MNLVDKWYIQTCDTLHTGLFCCPVRVLLPILIYSFDCQKIMKWAANFTSLVLIYLHARPLYHITKWILLITINFQNKHKKNFLHSSISIFSKLYSGVVPIERQSRVWGLAYTPLARTLNGNGHSCLIFWKHQSRQLAFKSLLILSIQKIKLHSKCEVKNC